VRLHALLAPQDLFQEVLARTYVQFVLRGRLLLRLEVLSVRAARPDNSATRLDRPYVNHALQGRLPLLLETLLVQVALSDNLVPQMVLLHALLVRQGLTRQVQDRLYAQGAQLGLSTAIPDQALNQLADLA